MNLSRFRSPFMAMVAAAALTTPMVLPAPVHAITVYDPSNYAQNLLQASRALQQIRNQIRSLQNEAQSLLNDARNLTKLPESVISEIDSEIQATQQLLRQAKGIAYNVKNIDKAFAHRYDLNSLSGSDKALVQQARTRWSDSVNGFQDALYMQAQIVQSMATSRQMADNLIGHSQASEGALQAAQAGNQLLALQLKQLTDLTALLAANGRAQILDAAGKASAKAQAREQFQRFLGEGNSYNKSSVRLFRE